ncbi:hypothetical protein EON67_01015 [archaeon]|nr:MAG: hypothetical protein EON67_01015 [archaeon]
MQGGMVYFDLSHNRTANVYGAAYQPYAIIDDYNLGMEMAVDGTYTCTAYCPISGPLTAYSVAGATDMGPTIILNRKAEVWVCTSSKRARALVRQLLHKPCGMPRTPQHVSCVRTLGVV